MNAAIENLTTHQRQLDQDGVEVGVSRQALDETLALVEEMRALLADCYIALHDHYREEQPAYDLPPEPADEWSYRIVGAFVAIQRVTGKDHDELMLKKI